MFLRPRYHFFYSFISKKAASFSQSKQFKHPLDIIQAKRKEEASRSVLFVFASPSSALLEHCHYYGSLSSVFLFERFDKEYALVEYSDQSSLKRLLSTTKHFSNNRRIPLESHLLYYQNNQRTRSRKSLKSPFKCQIVEDYRKVNLTDEHLATCKDVDSQIRLLHSKQQLSELDTRLRFFIAAQLEGLAKKVFPQASVELFGSVVTGLGRSNGDVDMTMNIEDCHKAEASNSSKGLHGAFFISKMRPENVRSFSQQMLECFGNLLKHLFPQLLHVHLILRARVPIIKFLHSPTDVECDVCFANQEAIEMSRRLYTLFNLHNAPSTGPSNHPPTNILPLIFVIRQWAKSNQVSHSNPGPWLSNFMLTLLCAFHLQQRNILPSIKSLQSKEDILVDFFKFYSTFDFAKHGISVYEGACVDKPLLKSADEVDVDGASKNQKSQIVSDGLVKVYENVEVNGEDGSQNSSHAKATISDGVDSDTKGAKDEDDCDDGVSSWSSSPLHLENPVERNLNAGKNVLQGNISHFQQACQQAYQLLSVSSRSLTSSSWGLLKILSVDDVMLEDAHCEEEQSLDQQELTANDSKA